MRLQTIRRYLSSRIESFLVGFSDHLSRMEEEEPEVFTKHAESLAARYRESDKNVSEEYSRHQSVGPSRPHVFNP